MNKLIVLFTAISLLIIAGCSGQEIALNDSFSEIENVELAITDKFGQTKLFRGEFISDYEEENFDELRDMLIQRKALLESRDEETINEIYQTIDLFHQEGQLDRYLFEWRNYNSMYLGYVQSLLEGTEFEYLGYDIIYEESKIIEEYICEEYPMYCSEFESRDKLEIVQIKGIGAKDGKIDSGIDKFEITIRLDPNSEHVNIGSIYINYREGINSFDEIRLAGTSDLPYKFNYDYNSGGNLNGHIYQGDLVTLTFTATQNVTENSSLNFILFGSNFDTTQEIFDIKSSLTEEIETLYP